MRQKTFPGAAARPAGPVAAPRPWRLLVGWDGEPGHNMALDEALLLSEGGALRLYTWRPDALSLGYFQRYDEVRGKERASALVRRSTGGGAIHHLHELTFAIAAPLDHPLYAGEVRASYGRVHAAIADALSDFGVRASLRGGSELESDDPVSGMCFHRSTPIDLAWGGRKGVGSAQRRARGRVLHHGSIKLAQTDLERGVASVATSPAALGDALATALARRVPEGLEAGELTPAEREHASRRAAHFTSPAHLRRR